MAPNNSPKLTKAPWCGSCQNLNFNIDVSRRFKLPKQKTAFGIIGCLVNERHGKGGGAKVMYFDQTLVMPKWCFSKLWGKQQDILPIFWANAGELFKDRSRPCSIFLCPNLQWQPAHGEVESTNLHRCSWICGLADFFQMICASWYPNFEPTLSRANPF